MLMNQNKAKSASSPRADINLSDLNELDGISLNEPPKPKRPRPSFTDIGANIFGSSKPDSNNIKLNISEPSAPPVVTAQPLSGIEKKPTVETSDGFKKFNNIPVAPTNPPPQG